jgi:hypothetical protein
MGARVNEMADLARLFCELIEESDTFEPAWLDAMATLLPRLHVAVGSLDGGNIKTYLPDGTDLDTRFEIFSGLRQRLGPNDSYWMEFDVAQDGQFMTGSLADDLTDIYCELKAGLTLLEEEPSLARDNWRNGYRIHWGQHLVDASRHLYELGARNQIRG